jgi:acyl-CoA synthetase (AMP-forming)/AMP-acid ligase II
MAAGCTPATSRPWTAGLRQHRRPPEGHGDPRRRERLSARDRGVPVPPPEDPGRAGDRRARSPYGEEICAWIKLHAGQSATAEEIREFCKGQIAHYKIPRYIEFVAEFPMTITGKIQKFVMREQTIGKHGLKELKTA